MHNIATEAWSAAHHNAITSFVANPAAEHCPAPHLLLFSCIRCCCWHQGQAVIPSGMAWQQHMLVLIMSAKLLADAEAALQMTPDASGSGASLVTCWCQ
jgi:hypothetical protein